ncbi:MAG: glycosyltransferase [Deinococcota bacterium]
MRVLQVINTLALAGAETLVKDIVLRLREHGIETDVYVLRRLDSPLEEDLKRAGVSLFGSTNLSVYSPKQVWSLAKHLSSHRYDLLHVHLFPAQLWAVIAAKFLNHRINLVTTEHSTHNRRRRWYFRHLDQQMYCQYSQIACISEGTKRALLNWLPTLAGKTHIVQNGVDVARFAQSESFNKTALLGIQPEAPLVLCVGRLEEPKDHATLLNAISRLEGVHLALVGDGPLRTELEALAAHLSITQQVHFLGRRTDIPRILKTADIYVQPSRWEGFGIATLEAMAAGLPIVASDVPGLADLVGNAGMLFPAGNVDTLADCLRLLLSRPDVRSELAQRAINRASEYDIGSTVERYLDLYKRVLAI